MAVFRSTRREMSPPIEHPEESAKTTVCNQNPTPGYPRMTGPDQAARGSAISDFLKRLEAQEKRGYTWLDEVLYRLPVPEKVDQAELSVPMQCCRAWMMRSRSASRPRPKITGQFEYGYNYQLPGISCSWTVEELRAVIELSKRPEFNAADIDDDLHKRILRAFDDKMIKVFNMREGSLDSDKESDHVQTGGGGSREGNYGGPTIQRAPAPQIRDGGPLEVDADDRERSWGRRPVLALPFKWDNSGLSH